MYYILIYCKILFFLPKIFSAIFTYLFYHMNFTKFCPLTKIGKWILIGVALGLYINLGKGEFLFLEIEISNLRIWNVTQFVQVLALGPSVKLNSTFLLGSVTFMFVIFRYFSVLNYCVWGTFSPISISNCLYYKYYI